MYTDPSHNERGQLLFELLIAISAAAIVLLLGAHSIYSALKGNKVAQERHSALGVLRETIDGARSFAFERWQNLSELTKGTAQYYPSRSAGEWTVVSGSDTIPLNGTTFHRYFNVRNVCRNLTTEAITGLTDSDGTTMNCTASGGSYDPSTQKFTATVTWGNNLSKVVNDYVTRWENRLCVQTSWSGGASSGVKTCPDTTYDTQSGIDFSLAGSLKASSVFASSSDGVLMYDETAPTTNVQRRVWTQSTATLSNEVSAFAGTGASKHIILKTNPVRSEAFAGIQDNAGTLTVYRSADGGFTWASQWSATVGDGPLARFDIAFENSSGDALVVYSANAATTNEIKFQIWNGTSWSGAQNFDPVRTSGAVYGIELEERSGSDEVAMAWADASSDLSASVWSGSAWGAEPSAALTANLARSTGTTPTHKSFDLAYESISDDLMVAFGVNGSTGLRYVFYSGGSWGTVSSNTYPEEPTMIDLSSSPISDKIGYANTTDSGNDFDAGIWSGTAWGTAVNDTTATGPAAGDAATSVMWLVDGLDEVALLLYSDTGASGIDWYQSNNGGTPVLQTDVTGAPAVNGQETSTVTSSSPSDPKQGVVAILDNNSDIFFKKVSVSGTTATWTSAEPGGVVVETSATVSGFHGAWFAHSRFSAGGASGASGQLTSSVFDTTGSVSGPGYNSLLWQGNIGTGKVRLKLATASSSAGPWDYRGPEPNCATNTAGDADWYVPAADMALEVGCALFHDGNRYFKYRIQLCTNTDCSTSGATPPQVDDVIVNWSP